MSSTLNMIKQLFNSATARPPSVCVEMSGNHQGSLDSAISFVHKAKAAGADLLKVQVYKPETITMKSDNPDFRLSADNDWAKYGTLYDLYEKAHTPWDWIAEMFKVAASIELPIFASPFDPTAVAFLEELDCPIYKIASPEITDFGLIECCAKTGKPIILSTGLASKSDLDAAVSILKKYGNSFIILKCVSAYPTPIEDMNLSSIPWLSDMYGCGAGLSDHTLGVEACLAATALGAVLIEKHFRLPEDNSSVDASFSMSLDELANLKKSMHAIFKSLGTPTLDIPRIAQPSLSGRRSLYAVTDIPVGESISNLNVKSIRPSFGMHPKYLTDLIGRPVLRPIKAGERMSWDMVD